MTDTQEMREQKVLGAPLINVGEVGIVNCHGRYLESYDNGEMHASCLERGDAQTWILWQVDWSRRLFLVQNKKTGLYLSKHDVQCVRASKATPGPTERWTILSGDAYVPGRLAFRAFDGTIMGSDEPGKHSGCGGEIMAADRPALSVGKSNEKWPGWFSLKTDEPVMLVEDGIVGHFVAARR